MTLDKRAEKALGSPSEVWLWQNSIHMIELTSLIGKTVFVNPDLIRSIETAPDTILCFLDGTRVPVKETPKQIQEKVIQFKQLVFQVSGKGFATWE